MMLVGPNLQLEICHQILFPMERQQYLILKVFHKVHFEQDIVTRSWKYSQNSNDTMPEKDFKRVNALCVKKKAVKGKVKSIVHYCRAWNELDVTLMYD